MILYSYMKIVNVISVMSYASLGEYCKTLRQFAMNNTRRSETLRALLKL